MIAHSSPPPKNVGRSTRSTRPGLPTCSPRGGRRTRGARRVVTECVSVWSARWHAVVPLRADVSSPRVRAERGRAVDRGHRASNLGRDPARVRRAREALRARPVARDPHADARAGGARVRQPHRVRRARERRVRPSRTLPGQGGRARGGPRGARGEARRARGGDAGARRAIARGREFAARDCARAIRARVAPTRERRGGYRASARARRGHGSANRSLGRVPTVGRARPAVGRAARFGEKRAGRARGGDVQSPLRSRRTR